MIHLHYIMLLKDRILFLLQASVVPVCEPEPASLGKCNPYCTYKLLDFEVSHQI